MPQFNYYHRLLPYQRIWPKSGSIFNDERISAWGRIYEENDLRSLWRAPFLFLFILFRPAKDAPNSKPTVKAQFIGLYLNGKPKGIKFRILKFSYKLTETRRNGVRGPRFDYHTTRISGAFLLDPPKRCSFYVFAKISRY